MNRVCREASRWFLCIALGACLEGFWPKSLAQTLPATQEASSPSLTVRIHNYAKLRPSILWSAKDIAGQVFSAIGIEVTWLDVPLDACEAPKLRQPPLDRGEAVVDASILPRSMTALAKLPVSTLGSTPMANEGDRATFADVYYDHIELEVRNTDASKARILGYVIAHELGHMLLRTSHHASTGIMIAQWRPVDLQRAAQGQLVFTSKQAQIIRAEVNVRSRQKNSPEIARLGVLNGASRVRRQSTDRPSQTTPRSPEP
jgi:hypothetical protein